MGRGTWSQEPGIQVQASNDKLRQNASVKQNLSVRKSNYVKLITMEVIMALKYDYTNINCSSWTKEDHKIANGFCWTLMAVEMQDVTEKNWKEILFRILYLQKIGKGPWTEDQETKVIIEWLKKLIGYGTNVGEKSRAKWLRHRTNYLARDVQADVEQELFWESHKGER